MMLALFAAAAVAAGEPPLAPPAATAVPAAAPQVGDADLMDLRGGFSLPSGLDLPTAIGSALSSQELSGAVGSNTINAGAVSSGAISFDGRALSGYSGIGNFLLNTGMNSLLQGAVNVTVNLAPAAGR